eukprot:794527-Pyramimonas_sp.AAC.1
MVAVARCPQRTQRGPPQRSSWTQASRCSAPSGSLKTCASTDSSGCRKVAGGQQNCATYDSVVTARIL